MYGIEEMVGRYSQYTSGGKVVCASCGEAINGSRSKKERGRIDPTRDDWRACFACSLRVHSDEQCWANTRYGSMCKTCVGENAFSGVVQSAEFPYTGLKGVVRIQASKGLSGWTGV